MASVGEFIGCCVPQSVDFPVSDVSLSDNVIFSYSQRGGWMRLTSGALLLLLRQKFGHGIRAAWYRDVVRPRILSTPPISGTIDPTCEVHVLTSAQDWLN